MSILDNCSQEGRGDRTLLATTNHETHKIDYDFFLLFTNQLLCISLVWPGLVYANCIQASTISGCHNTHHHQRIKRLVLCDHESIYKVTYKWNIYTKCTVFRYVIIMGWFYSIFISNENIGCALLCIPCNEFRYYLLWMPYGCAHARCTAHRNGAGALLNWSIGWIKCCGGVSLCVNRTHTTPLCRGTLSADEAIENKTIWKVLEFIFIYEMLAAICLLPYNYTIAAIIAVPIILIMNATRFCVTNKIFFCL